MTLTLEQGNSAFCGNCKASPTAWAHADQRKNQATIPVVALRRAGLKPGGELRVEAAGAGRIVLTRVEEALAGYAGRLTGVYPKGSLRKLRREWR